MYRFVPPRELAGRPHVMVDGAARPGTVITLSHWPGTPTPPALRADLSAEIARRALRHPEQLPSGLQVASIDHYDVDGVVALALVVLEGLDAAAGPLLVEAARVGDFDVVTDRRAALIAFSLNALGRARPATEGDDPLDWLGAVAAEALAILPSLAVDPEDFRHLWHDEYRAYQASVEALAEGWATIEEFPDIDLAVLRVDPDHRGGRATAWAGAPLHRAAVHGATACLRVATVAGRTLEMRYRYESWVRLASRRPRPRVDLERLAGHLTGTEKTRLRWVFEGAGATRGALYPAGHGTSTIEPGLFVELLRGELAALDSGPPAWNPYDPG